MPLLSIVYRTVLLFAAPDVTRLRACFARGGRYDLAGCVAGERQKLLRVCSKRAVVVDSPLLCLELEARPLGVGSLKA